MPAMRDPRVATALAYQGTRRRLRNPQHRFHVEFKPWTLQPFCIAPVIPGETLKHALFQARAVSKPLHATMRLTGWWLEYWLFYVKHRDLDPSIRDTVTNFMINPAVNLNALKTVAADAPTYTYNGAVDWLRLCLQRITEEYFREQGEAWNVAVLDTLPQVSVWGRGHSDWTDGLTLDSAKRHDYEDVGLDDATAPSAFEEAWGHWQALREAGLTQMDYEDYIRTYGERSVREDEASPNLHRPELLQYQREWQYPVNVVEATTGVPSTAVAWSIANRGDKAFKFTEPGFIVGLCTARPKVFLGRQGGYAAGMLDTPATWLPALTHDHYELAYKSFAEGTGPIPQQTTGDVNYWVDTRDLYIHGDQFVRAMDASVAWQFEVPATNTLNRRYATAGDIDSMFKGGTDAERNIMCDGVLNLSIAGRQSDRTPGAPI